MENLYFVSQSHYGHEYVWIFNEEGLKTCSKYNTIKNWLEGEKSTVVDILWPIGGSNSSATYIVKLESDEQARDYLLAKANGPDSDQPTLVDIAEYLRTVDVEDSSITQRILDKYNLKADDLTQVDDRYQELIDLGVKPEEFYGDRRDEFYYDVKEELERKGEKR